MLAKQGGKNSRLVPTVYLHMQTWGFQLKIICRLVRTLHGFPGFNQYPLSPSACSPTHFDAFQMHCSMTTLLQNERLTPLGMDQSVFPVSCRSCSWTILQHWRSGTNQEQDVALAKRHLENDFRVEKNTWWTCHLCSPEQAKELGPRLHVLCDRHPTQRSVGIRRGWTATGNNGSPFQDSESAFICLLYINVYVTPSTYP